MAEESGVYGGLSINDRHTRGTSKDFFDRCIKIRDRCPCYFVNGRIAMLKLCGVVSLFERFSQAGLSCRVVCEVLETPADSGAGGVVARNYKTKDLANRQLG